MAEALIVTERLTKYYGKSRGVEDLNLEVNKGEIFGFLGPNGAGKTTTIRTLLDFIHATRGRAKIFGLDTHKDSVKIKRRIGYLPGELELYGKLNGSEFLQFFSNLRGGVDWGYVEALAERLDFDMSKPTRSLSSGNRHKLGLIQAFMHKPELVVLDEPTTGLDPLMQQEFYRMILEAKKEGQTAFISSHILPEVERICDRVGFIRNGRLIDVEEISDLKAHAFRELEIHFAQPVPQDAFINLPGIRDVKVEDSIVRCKVAGSLDAVVKTVARFEVVNVISHETNLEDVFLAYYGGEKNAVS